jgi:hypothetical protein
MRSPAFFLFLFLPLLLLKAGIPLSAQTGEHVSLAAEIAKGEKLPADPAEKYEALLRLARLFQLSGNLERSAAAWIEAAAAAPGGRDDSALLEGARILIALGEYEKAEEGIALAAVREKAGALYLAALIDAFRSGDGRALVRMAEDPGFASRRGEIYYTLWKISGDVRWKDKLLEEFPQSPEGMIAKGAQGVSPAATPHWLLFPGRAAVTAAPPAVSAAASGTDASGAFLQTGLYGREENAAATAEKLKKAGFDALVRRRVVNGTGYWAVSVAPGQDMNRTIRILKEAGFDSFPVYE